MDSLTHIAIGACVGEAFFDKKIGKHALLWGALANSIPDIDFVAGLWMETSRELLAHRGFTHSLLFAFLITPVFALLADRLHRPHNITFRYWIFFFGTEVLLHLLLDGFNNYGIGWLEPFSDRRFTFNTIYVADPFFSVVPGVACLVLIFSRLKHGQRKWWWRAGIITPFMYLAYCAINKVKIDRDARQILNSQGISYTRYFTTPAPLTNWLWFVVAGNDEGYHIGFRSLFDSKKEIAFQYFPRNTALLDQIHDHEEINRLIRFSQQFYTVEQWGDTLVFNDLRFGQILGWEQPRSRFVFHYFLEHPEDNRVVVQRGRFAGWNRRAVRAFLKRIIGE